MFRTPFVVLAVVACTQARPHLQSFVPLVPASSGTSNSGITRGETVTPFGDKSTITNHHSVTGGQAFNGGFNFGTASSDTQSLQTPHGTSSTSNTDTQSEQGSSSIFDGLGGGIVLPAFPVLHGLGPSSAKGQSGSNIVTGETIGPNGSKSTITKQQSGTGGQALNGGSNFGTASSDTQSLDTPHGTSSTSNTDSKSVQTSNPTFAIGGGSPVLPIVPVIPLGFESGSASGNSASGIKQAETIGPFGDRSTVVQMESGTGGQASNGGFNFGTASSNTQSVNTPHGTSRTSNTDNKSVQGSKPSFLSFDDAPGLSAFPAIPTFDFGSATGSANSGLTQSKAVGADGSQTTVTVLGSSASGSAKNGGTSVNKASGSTSSIDGISGSQTKSDLDTQSIQTGR